MTKHHRIETLFNKSILFRLIPTASRPNLFGD